MKILKGLLHGYDLLLLFGAFAILACSIIFSFSGSTYISALFSDTCHQLPERSFNFFGCTMLICSRCMGIYSGYLIGRLSHGIALRFFLIQVKTTTMPQFILLLFLMLAGFSEWLMTSAGIFHSTNYLRLLAGICLGVSYAKVIHGLSLNLMYRGISILEHS